MTCVGRHSNGPANNVCEYYDAGTNPESCGAVGDFDDVCVCRAANPVAVEVCTERVALNAGDVLCGGECTGDTCTCAVMFDNIPDGQSCK
jgi:hypothetical protein